MILNLGRLIVPTLVASLCLSSAFAAEGPTLTSYLNLGIGPIVLQSEEYRAYISQTGFKNPSSDMQVDFGGGFLYLNMIGFGAAFSGAQRTPGYQYYIGPTVRVPIDSLRFYGQYGWGEEQDFFRNPTTNKDDVAVHRIEFLSAFLGVKFQPGPGAAKTADPAVGIKIMHFWMTEDKVVLNQKAQGNFTDVLFTFAGTVDVF